MGKARKTNIPVKIKARVFKGLVTNTMISGLEGEVLRTCDYERMESCVMGLARRILGKLSIHSYEGTKRQHTNEHVRRLLGLTCIRDLL